MPVQLFQRVQCTRFRHERERDEEFNCLKLSPILRARARRRFIQGEEELFAIVSNFFLGGGLTSTFFSVEDAYASVKLNVKTTAGICSVVEQSCLKIVTYFYLK
jgi:hypothetical protein